LLHTDGEILKNGRLPRKVRRGIKLYASTLRGTQGRAKEKEELGGGGGFVGASRTMAIWEIKLTSQANKRGVKELEMCIETLYLPKKKKGGVMKKKKEKKENQAAAQKNAEMTTTI